MERGVYNFNAGPATLPSPVLEKASQAVLEFGNLGMSILEVSHRSKEYEDVHYGTQERLLRILGLNPQEYNVLLMGGGASLQFAMLPMNYLKQGQVADYVDTGHWSRMAIEEAQQETQLVGGVIHVAGSLWEQGYSHIPKKLELARNTRYVHITTNNTIEGTEWPELPETGDIPLIADASSDLLGRNWDYSRFSLLYAGAQKNAGPAGVTLVVARKSFLEEASIDIPRILSYQTHFKHNSLYNTPPTFAVYATGLMLEWIEEQGGLASMEERNRKKAGMLYEALDRFPDVFVPLVTEERYRSIMNVTFKLQDSFREQKFLEEAELRRMVGLKGHRSVGGIRASIYNAFPIEGVAALAEYLEDFARKS